MAAKSVWWKEVHDLRRFVAELTSLYLKHRKHISYGVYAALLLTLVSRIRNVTAAQKSAAQYQTEIRKSIETELDARVNANRRPRIELNRQFLKSLLRLLKICIPGLASKESRLVASHTFFLVLRTLLSLYVAELDGKVVASLVKGQGRQFVLGLVWWMVVAVPAVFTNSMLQWHQCKLALAYRTRLTNHIHKRYLEKMTFYALSALDDRVKNADQLITVDVSRFSNSLAELYSNLAKPILDMLIYNYSLSKSVGGEGLFAMALLVQVSASMMRALTPPFGKYVAEEARLEGEFRFQHTRLIDYSEEIALYGGHEAEKDGLDKGYFTLIKHINRILRRRFYHGLMEDFVIKYFWGALGLMLCSIPVFFKLPGRDIIGKVGDRTESFVTNRRMLLSSSDAFGRIMFSYKEITELAGYTSRVASLLEVMDEVSDGKYQKQLVSSISTEENNNILKGRGEVMVSDIIKFEKVPIISPNGDVLVKALSFEIKPGDHLLIVGPNGCGKSSLFRILGGLWPVYGGRVCKPAFEDIFYIPQRPYLSRGTLRDQIIYPDSLYEYRAKHGSDDDLLHILSILSIDAIVDRKDGWEAVEEWKDVFSNGLQQRIAMARLFYHKPKYAILDECTSSVTSEMEKIMYDTAKSLGTTLMTVSHRRSLWRYHNFILRFDGNGGFGFGLLDADTRIELEDERDSLLAKIREAEALEERHKEPDD